MKVICNIGYEATHRVEGVRILFKRGQVYDTFSEYDNCYLFLINQDIFIMKKLYFLTLEQVAKRKMFSFQTKD